MTSNAQSSASQTSAMQGGVLAAAGAAVLGAASTLGDWIWLHFLTDGSIVAGVAHGLIFFLLLAVIFAFSVGTPTAWRRLLPTLPLCGFLLAGAIYPIALAVGYLPALMVTWVAMWLLLALLLRWALAESAEAGGVRRALLRALLAAVGSGLAFWMISGIWTSPSGADPLTAQRFGAWTFAFAPGLLALLVGQALRRT